MIDALSKFYPNKFCSIFALGLNKFVDWLRVTLETVADTNPHVDKRQQMRAH